MNDTFSPGRARGPQSFRTSVMQRGTRRFTAVLAASLAMLSLPAGAVTLGELVQQAAFNNPAAVARQRAVDAAGESISSARWQFFPTPSMSVERAGATSKRDVSYGGDDTVVILRLQQTLWSGGRLTAQLEQAGHNRTSAEEALREQRFRLAEQVISQYSLWVRSDLAAEANQKNLKALEDFLAQSQRREKEGAAARVDVTLVRGRRDQALTDLLGAKASRQSARLQLEQLVGLPLRDEELRADVVKLSISEELPVLTESMLQSSPLLKRLRADAKVQESAIRIRSASYWPEVYARLEHQRGNFSVAHTAVKVTLAGVGLDVLNDRLILDTALALNTDLAMSSGKTVGGVAGLSYGYDSASRTLTLSKTGGASWSGSEVQSVLQAIKLGGSSTHDGVRTASFRLVSSTGESGNASTAGILFDTHAPTLDADATLVDLQTSSRKAFTAARAAAGVPSRTPWSARPPIRWM